MTVERIDSPSGRKYLTPAGTFPSITTILSATKNMYQINAWRERVGEAEANKILADAAYRGTAVHSLIELRYTNKDFDLDKECINYPSFIKTMVTLISKDLDENNFKPIHQEIKLYHPELKYAGTCDAIGWYNNMLVVIDFKTSIKIKKIEYVNDYFIQAAAYALAYNYLYKSNITKTVILLATEDGKFQKWIMPVPVYASLLKSRLNQYYATS